MKVNINAGKIGIELYKAKGGKEETQRTNIPVSGNILNSPFLMVGLRLSLNYFKKLHTLAAS